MHTTRVSFSTGALSGEGEVLLVDRDRSLIIVDATPFHPVDHTWPDQPGDTGIIAVDGVQLPIVDTVMAALGEQGQLAVDTEIPARRGAEGWTWLVAHRAGEQIPAQVCVGTTVTLRVDALRRAALSRGHTACHLASLALNAALSDLWHKEVAVDPLGNPDFESRANQSSRIHRDGSVDEYRLGKSLRKAGFDTAGMIASLPQRESAVNDQLASWLAGGGVSRIDVAGEGITDRRTWRCGLADGDVAFLCGGTHVQALSEFAQIRVRLDATDPQQLVLTTTATPA